VSDGFDVLRASFRLMHLPASFPKACTDAVEVEGKSMEPTVMDGAVIGFDIQDRVYRHDLLFIVKLKSGNRNRSLPTLCIKFLSEWQNGRQKVDYRR